MRKYSLKEKDAAMERLPQPVRDFLGSLTLTGIYEGLATKLGLSFKQSLLMGEIANVTLMKLEDEHALETNIHQMMPELSNTAARELAADLEDRVFREATRRIRENVLEPNPLLKDALEGLTSEEIAERKRRDAIDAMEDNDPELQKLLEVQEKLQEERKKAEEAELEEARKKATEATVTAAPSALSTENATLTNPETPAPAVPVPPSPSPQTPSIAQTKLGVPTTTKPVESSVPQTLSSGTPERSQPPALQKRVDGIDPYREPLD